MVHKRQRANLSRAEFRALSRASAAANEAATAVLLIDDLRNLSHATEVARTSAEGVALLKRYRGLLIKELWLDHDLGGDDTIWPVIVELERAAYNGDSYDIQMVYVHTSNPSGASRMVQALQRMDYHTRRTAINHIQL